jgi:hypothetical protein
MEKRRKNGRRKRAYRTKEREWTRLEKESTEDREQRGLEKVSIEDRKIGRDKRTGEWRTGDREDFRILKVRGLETEISREWESLED